MSRLALKRHFRRSAIFDKVPSVRNQDLSIVELTSESGESVSSKEFNDGKDVVVINSSESEDESHLKPELVSVRKKNASKSNKVVHQWLDNVEQSEKAITFFSQVSTIYDDDEGPKTDKKADLVAACSSFNDYLTHRFDELFINKDTGKTHYFKYLLASNHNCFDFANKSLLYRCLFRYIDTSVL